MLEFASIAVGIHAADAMVKQAPVASIRAGTVHPGKYLVLVDGDTASVEVALEAGRSGAQAELFLPDVHPTVPAAMAAGHIATTDGDAIGVVETDVAAIAAADAAVKAARVELGALRLADGLGGKGYLLLTGPVAEVEAGVEAGVSAAGAALVASTVVARLHEEIAENLAGDLRFLRRVRAEGGA
jgi:microcompartment protein CcmL/EutN